MSGGCRQLQIYQRARSSLYPVQTLSLKAPRLIVGNSASTPTLQVRFEPQDQPVAAIDPRFCEPRSITLQEKSEFFKRKLTYQDVHTDAIRFTFEGGLFTNRRTLLDADDTPIVTYKDKKFSTKPITYVYAGATCDGDPLLEIYAEYHSGDKTVVKVEFDDLLTGVRCELDFTGHWRCRDGFFWLAKGPTGLRKPVAKIHLPDGLPRQTYHVDIVPNMDTALIVLICNILGRVQRSRESTSSDAPGNA